MSDYEDRPQSHLPEIKEFHGVPVAHMPPETSVEVLEKILPRPTRIRQSVTLHSIEDFVKYVERYDDGEGAVFYNADTLTFKAIVDYHTEAQANWGDHIASFTLKKSRELRAWERVNGESMTQSQWLEFLEDRSDDFRSPSAAEIITIVRDFKAKKVSDFKSVHHLQNGDVDLAFTTKTTTTGKVDVPTVIDLLIPVFANGDPSFVRGKFRYHVSGEGQLTIKMVFPRIAELLDVQSKAVADLVKNALGAPLYLGAP